MSYLCYYYPESIFLYNTDIILWLETYDKYGKPCREIENKIVDTYSGKQRHEDDKNTHGGVPTGGMNGVAVSAESCMKLKKGTVL